MDTLIQAWHIFLLFVYQGGSSMLLLSTFVPFVLFLELPLYFVGWLGVFRHILQGTFRIPRVVSYFPRVTCTIACYAEGMTVQNTVISLLEQIYPGYIEIIAMVDGAQKNRETYEALTALQSRVLNYDKRSLIVVPKIQRGGRVSSLNAGLSRASGEVLLILDADTSFDNQMIQKAVVHFKDPNTIAVTGPMRVRNASKSLITRLQNLEYMLNFQIGKLGLTNFNIINNIPGAFGIFRKSFIQQIGGWNSGTAEDLDMTVRIKQYQRRYPNLKVNFELGAVSHTDVPETFKDFMRQRLRWDGDLWYIYINKHNKGFSASIMGWRNLFFLIWYALLFQIVTPFSIVIYMCYAAYIQPLPFFLASMLLVYSFYLGLAVFQFALYLVLVSDRARADSIAWLIVPIYPFFQFIVRIWSAIALTNEIVNKGHLDSTMAPYWVLRRGKQ